MSPIRVECGGRLCGESSANYTEITVGGLPPAKVIYSGDGDGYCYITVDGETQVTVNPKPGFPVEINVKQYTLEKGTPFGDVYVPNEVTLKITRI